MPCILRLRVDPDFTDRDIDLAFRGNRHHPMPALVRSASLTHFAEVAAQCGLDGRALVVEVGLPPRCLDDPDLKVPTRRVGRLFELAAERAHEPAFGLRMVESRRLSNLGPLGLLVRDEPTLRSALEALMRYIHLHNEAVAVRVEQVGNLVVIREELDPEGASSVRQASEVVVGVTYRVLQVFMGSGWHPRLVCFSHSAPPSLAVHHRVLGPAVEFGHEFNGIVCNAADLDAPNPGADPVMARFAQRLLGQSLDAQARLTERVRQLVVLLLPRGLCRVEVVAQHLGIDRRTVARRLAEEKTTFSALVNQLRRDLFARYLDDGARTLTEVSALLGFSAPSAFSRWHRQQYGVAARELKARRMAKR
jgi:AraC-like DNA-binding protein